MKSSVQLGVVALAILLVSSVFAISLALPATAASAPVAPTATKTFTLYGDTTDGWGTSSTTIANPGPSLTVTEGDTVTIHLFSNDSVTHSWFIDFNNNNAPDSGEPISLTFSSATTAVDFPFTVPTGHIGTATYRCGPHPTTMTGSITIQAAPLPPTFTLYGNAQSGWGLTSTSINSPGPTLNVTQGQTATIDLYAADGVDHTFYIDWDRNGRFDSGTETQVNFNSSTTPVRYTFTASSAGNFTYYCSIHPTAMKGIVHVDSSGATPPSSPDYTLYAALIIVIVIVAVAVGLFIRRKPRSPPQQPPQQP